MKSLRVALATLLVMGSASLFAQNLVVDYRLSTKTSDGNYFTWTAGKNKPVKDSYDAASGASLAGTTLNFNSVLFDSAKTSKSTMAKGLRSLFLYPMSAMAQQENDDFTVTANGKALTIRFVHRDIAYEITTDSTGKLNVETGFKKATVADNNKNVFTVKPEFLKAGADNSVMSSVDWSKVNLTADTKSADAKRYYKGILQCDYTNDILTITGTLESKK